MGESLCCYCIYHHTTCAGGKNRFLSEKKNGFYMLSCCQFFQVRRISQNGFNFEGNLFSSSLLSHFFFIAIKKNSANSFPLKLEILVHFLLNCYTFDKSFLWIRKMKLIAVSFQSDKVRMKIVSNFSHYSLWWTFIKENKTQESISMRSNCSIFFNDFF